MIYVHPSVLRFENKRQDRAERQNYGIARKNTWRMSLLNFIVEGNVSNFSFIKSLFFVYAGLSHYAGIIILMLPALS